MADEIRDKVVAPADSSFLIGLSFIDRVDLLGELFERVYVAPAVWEEVVVLGDGQPGSQALSHAPFIERRPVTNVGAAALLRLFLGPGESETLMLAQELSCPLVLMDELRGRKAAHQAGIRTMGVVGFLLLAKREGHIERVRPFMETLTSSGFRLGKVLIETALREAGEGS